MMQSNTTTTSNYVGTGIDPGMPPRHMTAPLYADALAELDNGVESEDSPEATALPLPSSWAQPSLSDNAPSVLYEPKQGPGIGPDVSQAEAAMDTVLAFVDAQDHGWITHEERGALQHIKLLLIQTGQGLPYHREF